MGMWKNSYAVGNALIDSQHMELFRMADELVATVRRQDANSPEACARAVTFLKDYVVKHFADEEALQAALGYSGLERHRQLHREFVTTVLEYEKSLSESNFAPKIMQQFAGKLIGWLIYHVVGEDGKITGMVAAAPPIQIQDQGQDQSAPGQLITYFADSACEILGQMLDIAVQTAPETPPPVSGKNDISIDVGLSGDYPGNAEFVFPLVTASRIVQSMTAVDTADFGEMVESALREIANIISGNAASKLAETGCACDITTPNLYRGQRPIRGSGKIVRCDLGALVVSLVSAD
ncbi:MAG: bacteriohemerythrin [Peptococcaceae bacterium]|jgi:hemerythrin|nr:bacteriohemerythrin [Peptococcaceae bacterium]